MRFNGIVKVNEAIEFNLSVQRIFKLNLLVPHLHQGTNDSLSFAVGLRSGNASKALTDVVLCAGLNKCVMGRTSILLAVV